MLAAVGRVDDSIGNTKARVIPSVVPINTTPSTVATRKGRSSSNPPRRRGHRTPRIFPDSPPACDYVRLTFVTTIPCSSPFTLAFAALCASVYQVVSMPVALSTPSTR